MRFLPLICGFLLLNVGVVLGQGTAPSRDSALSAIDAVKLKYEAAFKKLATSEEPALGAARNVYIADLEKLKLSVQQKGNLDEVTEVDRVLEAAKQGKGPDAIKTSSPQIQKVGASYQARRSQIMKSTARASLETEYDRTLRDLEQRYTRTGNLDAARAARELRLDGVPGSTIDMLPGMKGSKEVTNDSMVIQTNRSIQTDAPVDSPVEIQYEVKVGDQLRIGYGAKVIIFNWEQDKDMLAIDGGPASGQNRKGSGALPLNKWVTIKQTVLAGSMTIAVDGKPRATWQADFSTFSQPIIVYATNAPASVRYVKVRKLDR